MTIIFANTISVKNCKGVPFFFLFDILTSKNKGKYSTFGGGVVPGEEIKKHTRFWVLFKGGCSDRGMVAVPVACHCMLHYMVNFLRGFSI